MSQTRKILIWVAFAAVIVIPITAAAMSPQLAWRGPAYIVAGFAGVLAMVFLLAQPLLMGGYLPGLSSPRERQLHRIVGSFLVVAVLVHVIGLWITSAPDVVDALFFRSPTPFSAWGVIAMWTVFAAAILALLRRWLRLRMQVWHRSHTAFAAVTVVGSVVHAMLIEGTMEMISKAVLCALVVVATAKLLVELRLKGVRNSK